MASLTFEKNSGKCEDSDMIIIRDPRASNSSSKRINSKDESTENKSLVKTVFSCDICKKCFLDSPTLKKHISQHNIKIECSPKGEKNVNCTSANSGNLKKGETSSRIDNIVNDQNKNKVKQIRMKRSNHIFPPSLDISPFVKKEVENSWNEWKTKEFYGKNPAICSICFEHFEDLIKLRLHNKIHLKANVLPQCRLCLTFQQGLSDLNRHMICHVNKTSFTSSQMKNSTSPENMKKKEKWLSKHKQSGIKKYLKGTQKEDTNQNKNVRYDKQVISTKPIKKVIKTGISPTSKEFSCDICFAKFTFACNRNKHKQKHGLSSSHECKSCKKIFNSAVILIAHEKSHIMEGFVCHLCQKSFVKIDDLHEHLRLRHANVIRSSYDLSIREDRQVEITTCYLCQETMGGIRELKEHLRLKHANVTSSSIDSTRSSPKDELMITVKKELIDEDLFEAKYNPILSANLNDISANVNTTENDEQQSTNDKSDSDIDWDDVVLDDSSDEAEIDSNLDMVYNDNIVGYSVEDIGASKSQDICGNVIVEENLNIGDNAQEVNMNQEEEAASVPNVYNDKIVGYSVKDNSQDISGNVIVEENVNIDDYAQEVNMNQEEEAADVPNVYNDNIVGYSVKDNSQDISGDVIVEENVNIDDNAQEVNMNQEEQTPDVSNVVLTNVSVEEALRFFSS